MTLKRTLVAECDYRTTHLGHEVRSCTVSMEMNPNTTQPFHDLADADWVVAYPDEGDILTFCPEHKEQAK